jgi:hypothetical protein
MMVYYRLLWLWIFNLYLVWVGGLGWWAAARGGSSRRRVHIMISGDVVVISMVIMSVYKNIIIIITITITIMI